MTLKPPHPDEQDAKLQKSRNDSLYQRIRLLTHDERAVLDALLDGGDIAEVLTKDGKPKKSLRALRDKVPDIMDRLGMTDEFLIDTKLRPLLDAHKTEFLTASYKGDITIEEREVEALEIRRSSLDMAFKLRGSYQDGESTERKVGDITVRIINVGA